MRPRRRGRSLAALALALLGSAATAACLFGDRSDEDPALAEYRPRPEGELTWAADIAPLVHAHCAPCHRPGEAGPFSLLTYEDVRKHAGQIVDVTRSRFMPPWLPEPGHGEFLGERRLDVDEIGLVTQWVREGAAEGDPAAAPPPPQFPDGWQLGIPDLVLRMDEPYRLAEGGEDVFRNFVFRTGLAETRWVRGLEFRPEGAQTLHHATIAVDPTSNSRYHDARDPEPGFDGMLNASARRPDGHLLGWVPGKRPTQVDESIAWRLDPGTDLVVQLHMRPTGRAETVNPLLGLYFADRPAERTPVMIRLGPRTLDIPAGAKEYAVQDAYVLPVDVELLGIAPHAHYLGKEMRASATLPDGTERPLLYIEQWDFDWQDEYRYREPLALPKGTTVSMRFTFDNSSRNIRNPHQPPQRVVFGPRTADEMGDLWLQVLARDAADQAVLRRDFARKELEATLDCYEKMLEIDSADLTARFELGETLHAQGRRSAAIAHYRQVLDRDVRHVPARTALGRALHSEGQYDDALRHFAAALEEMPELPEVHFNRGQSLVALGRADEALAAFGAALALRPTLAEATYAIGNLRRAAGDLDGAAAAYREALAVDDGLAEAHNNLGSLLASRGKLDEAQDHFQRAVEADPGYAQARNNLGMALASRGELDAAISQFAEAVRLRPTHEESQRNLAMALALKQRRDGVPAQSD